MLHRETATFHLMRTAWVFLKRDIAIESTYRTAVLIQISNVFFWVIVFSVLSRLIGERASAYLRNYDGVYLSFVIVGIAFSSYMHTGLTCFGERLREAQMVGTLEATLMTPVAPAVFMLSSGIWSHMQTTLRALAYVVIGALMGIDLSGANIPGALLALVLGVFAFDALGLVGASVVMLAKRALPLAALFSTASALLSGVYFPVELLPNQIKWLAALLPSTYALEGLRLSLLGGATFAALLPHLLPLVFFNLVALPAGLLAFHLARGVL